MMMMMMDDGAINRIDFVFSSRSESISKLQLTNTPMLAASSQNDDAHRTHSC
jgi:hypothetical protein